MITEKEFQSGIAEIILGALGNNAKGLTKAEICRDGHFSPEMLTPKKLLSMKSDTLMRLLLYLGITMRDVELFHIFMQLYQYISKLANDNPDAAYDIIDNHAGSPIYRTRLIDFL